MSMVRRSVMKYGWGVPDTGTEMRLLLGANDTRLAG
jgi:hypothetical protein